MAFSMLGRTCWLQKPGRFWTSLDAQVPIGSRISSKQGVFLNFVKASLAYFSCVFGAGFLLALVRIPLLVPRLGERWAELLEMPFMLLVIVMAARWVTVRFGLKARRSKCLAVGIAALVLMLAAESILVMFVQEQAISAYIASRDPVSGSVYLLMLLVFAVFPFVISGRQDR
jgi:hypothetical protein